ncbi:hypothetical protein [uncultured Shewanella sp.]|uniref:hypothetical protein n=1 Tax=uncultured Shewanella sp. TaxID=173975 RepID=UPI00263763DC|nr:hypothetical protein [uncultured Shewanella sp.]
MRIILLLQVFISFHVFSSVHSIEERELSFKESEALGFLKVNSLVGNTPDDLIIMQFTFPNIVEGQFEIRDVYLEGISNEKVVFKTSLHIDNEDNHQ